MIKNIKPINQKNAMILEIPLIPSVKLKALINISKQIIVNIKLWLLIKLIFKSKVSNTALEIKSSLLKFKNKIKIIIDIIVFLTYEISYRSSKTPIKKKIEDKNKIFFNIMFDGSKIIKYETNIINNGKAPINGT